MTGVVMRAFCQFIMVLLATVSSACSMDSTNDLIWAAHEGNLENVRRLIANGTNVNARAFDDGQTALIAAVRGGQSPMIEFLLSVGADINLKDAGGTPLYWAAFGGQAEIFDYLLTRGARLDADEKSLSYLLLVMRGKGFTELAKVVRAEAEREARGK